MNNLPTHSTRATLTPTHRPGTLVRWGFFLAFAMALSLVPTIARGAEWLSDYEKGLASAKVARKYVLLNFTGSDWCGPCIEMKRVVFSTPEFEQYADKNLILVELDYPKRKALPEEVARQNEQLKRQYGINRTGYPTLFLLDPDGKIVGHLVGYGGQPPAAIIGWIESLRENKSPMRPTSEMGWPKHRSAAG